MDKLANAEKSYCEMKKLQDRSQRDIAKIKEMLEQRLARGVFVDITLFEGTIKQGFLSLPFYWENDKIKGGPGENIRGIVRAVDRSNRYIRVERYTAHEKNEQFDVFGSAIHSYKIDTRNYSADLNRKTVEEHAKWGKEV